MNDMTKNTDEQKDEELKEPSFSERLKIEPIRKKCVCGKSKKYPLCDGSHSKE
jgi:CDGSH-type Zn-finger protein